MIPPEDPKMTAGLDMLHRTGATQVQIRWSDDEEPTVWFAVAIYNRDRRWETAAAHGPVEAILRLCEQVIDGGRCAHCSKPTMFIPKLDDTPTPFDSLCCIYEWDPEVKTFRRGCEGE